MSLNTILATAPLTTTNYILKATGTTIGNSLIFDNGTNVGIGNTNTTYKLDVSGTGNFTGALSGTSATFSSSVQVGSASTSTGGLLVIGGSSIGTANANNGQIYLGATAAYRGVISYDEGPGYLYIDNTYNNASSNIYFRTKTSGTAITAMTILGSGNVGIGTSSPAAKLTVATGTGETIRMVGADTIGDNYMSFFNNAGTRKGYIGYGYSNNDYLEINQEANDAIIISTNAVERMRITSGGTVTIQTPTSGTALLAYGKANEWTIQANASTTSSQSYGLKVVAGTNNSDSSMNINNAADTTTYFKVRGDGFVYLNDATSSARFNIRETGTVWAQIINHTRTAGQFFIQFQYNGSEIGAISGNSSNTTYATSSDYRLKEDLKDFNGIDLVNKLSVYDFAWKSDNTRRMYGVLAHELSDIVPYAVNKEKDLINEDGTIDAQGVDYSLITPLLVKAIQEQQALITSLQEQINELKNK